MTGYHECGQSRDDTCNIVLETQRRQNKQKTQHKSLTNEDEQKTTEHRRTEQKHYIENYKMKTNKTKNNVSSLDCPHS
jgi:hypothetical protein